MLAYVRHLVLNYVYQDGAAAPSHEFYELLTSEHLETFHVAFGDVINLNETPAQETENNENHSAPNPTVPEVAPANINIDRDTTQNRAEVEIQSTNTRDDGPSVSLESPRDRTASPAKMLGAPIHCDSPSRSDEGYGSYCGEYAGDQGIERELDGTNEEIVALGIIEECEEVPDYGVALVPSPYTSISPQKRTPTRHRSSNTPKGAYALSQGASPTRQRLAEMSGPTPKIRRSAPSRTGVSENARNLMTMGYTLSLLGEKFDKTRSIEGSVKSVILKAGQTIEKSQSGSVYGKSRYNGSRYAGSKCGGGSRFGGSKRSVARSIVLEETLPSWGF